MNVLRDPRTGRFLPKPKKNENLSLGEKINKILESPIKVFGKKDISGKPALMPQGANVILEKNLRHRPNGNPRCKD
jgi:hypothetical protein